MQETINSQSMLKVGTVLRGIYRIDSYLSSGGFGNTYVATNIEFDERVAIKEFFMKGVTQRDGNHTTVSVSNAENQDSFIEQREKFKKEARRLRRLANPHIVSVHDLFEENGTAYYVMDYVDGENLAERLKRTGKPMTETEVNEILPQILDALKAVHDAYIWHLDLKPANIMLNKDGQVRLIDFGASKQLHAQKGGATTSTAISYTNGYAPREQMEQNYDKFGPWTDIYALGATLYNLLTNKRPPLPTDIDDDTSDDKHLALPFPASVSQSMKRRVLWLMSTNRMQRPQNISAILNEDIDEDTIIEIAPPKPTQPSQPKPQPKQKKKENISYDTDIFWFLPSGVRTIIIIIVTGGVGVLFDATRFFLIKSNLFDNHPAISVLCMLCILILSVVISGKFIDFAIHKVSKNDLKNAYFRRKKFVAAKPSWIAPTGTLTYCGVTMLPAIVFSVCNGDGDFYLVLVHIFLTTFPLIGWTIFMMTLGLWIIFGISFSSFFFKKTHKLVKKIKLYNF